MSRAREGIDFCRYCSVIPRNPCRDDEEASECPNASPAQRESCRSSLPGYSQSEADELAEYRRRYGRLR
jgi:hypothetical protein